jgi:hypothetical protein
MNVTDRPSEAEVAALADRIEQIVSAIGGSASHGELLNRLADVPTRGKRFLEVAPLRLVMMVGLSDVMAAAIERLMDAGRLVAKPVRFPAMVLTDGTPLPPRMPLAKCKPPSGGYRKPRFWPALLALPQPQRGRGRGGHS